MNWWIVLKHSLSIAIFAIPIQLYAQYLNLMMFYQQIRYWELIIFGLFCLVFIAVSFNSIYQKMTKLRVFQSVLTIFISFVFSYVIAIVLIISYLTLFSNTCVPQFLCS
jgi:hypothetical protein